MILSVITINLNNLSGLQKTMASVFSQQSVEFEYILIDGGSDDGSAQFIKDHAQKMDYWISESDAGVYNAMNKGIRKAKGKYLLFLNSGDYLLEPTSLSCLLEQNFSEDIIYWDMVNNVTGTTITYPYVLTFSYFLESTLCHQSTLIKRQLFFDYGPYNEGMTIAADWAFYVKMLFLHQASYRYLRMYVTQYEFGFGISQDPQSFKPTAKEKLRFLDKWFSGFLPDYKKMDKLKLELTDRYATSIKLSKKSVKIIRKIRKKLGLINL